MATSLRFLVATATALPLLACAAANDAVPPAAAAAAPGAAASQKAAPASAASAKPTAACIAGDTPFKAAYAVAPPPSSTGEDPASLSVNIYEAAPKTDQEKKDACEYFASSPAFAKAGRSLSVYFDDKSKTASNVVLHEHEDGPKSNWIADTSKATVETSGKDLTLKVHARWSDASCEITLPVVVCP